MSNETISIRKLLTDCSTREIPTEFATLIERKAKNPFKAKQYVCESFQRKACWSNKEKRLYIDSLLGKMALTTMVIVDIRKCLSYSKNIGDKPSIKYYSNLLSKNYEYISVDGQNRVNAIVSFILNEYTVHTQELIDSADNIHPPLENVYFKDMLPQMRSEILNNRFVNVTFITDKVYQDLSTIFQRLQCGLPLVEQEKRNGMFTPIAKWSRSISNKYSNMFGMILDDKSIMRMGDRELASKIALCLEKDSDLGQADLTSYYEAGIGTDQLDQRYDKTILETDINYLFDSMNKAFRKDQLKYGKPNFWLFCLSLRHFTKLGYVLTKPYQFKLHVDKRITSLTTESKSKMVQDEQRHLRGELTNWKPTGYFHARKNRTHLKSDRQMLLSEFIEHWNILEKTDVFIKGPEAGK